MFINIALIAPNYSFKPKIQPTNQLSLKFPGKFIAKEK